MPDVHALLGPSSADRWIACPGSVGIGKQFEDTTSVYAAEGTLAHSLAELRARKRYTTDLKPSEYEEQLAALQADPLYNVEMMECTSMYLDLIDSILEEHKNPNVFLEQQLDYSELVPAKTFSATSDTLGQWVCRVPNLRPDMQNFISFEADNEICMFSINEGDTELRGTAYPNATFTITLFKGFGTGDCVIVSDERIDVVDYKHGKGVRVEVQDNSQLKLYGAAAVLQHRGTLEVTSHVVGTHICQPRNGGNSSALYTVEEILNWAHETVKPAAERAHKCYGMEADDIPKDMFCAGSHCKFCKAKAVCKVRGAAVAVEVFGKKEANTYSDEELAAILSRSKAYVDWVSDIESYCLDRAMKGNPVPGFKAVNGRGTRVFKNPETAFAALSLYGFKESDFYVKKPLSVAQAEKVVGKRVFKCLGDMLFETKPGKPTLAPASDARPALTIAEVFRK